MSEEQEGIEVTDVSVPFEYFIPRFSCVSFTIRQITFNAELDGTVHTYDGFIHDKESHNNGSLALHSLPAVVDVYESCFVEVNVVFSD